MMFEDLWGPHWLKHATLLAQIKSTSICTTNGANPSAICTSICTNSCANPGAICTSIYTNLMQENASKSKFEGVALGGFEGVKLTLLRGLDVIDLRWLESIELRGWILARQIAPSQFLPRGSFLARFYWAFLESTASPKYQHWIRYSLVLSTPNSSMQQAPS